MADDSTPPMDLDPQEVSELPTSDAGEDDRVSAQDPPPQDGPVVVGIGASAGGLEAFQAFFEAMPADSGMAFVLVSHLDPSHESMLADLLSRHTEMSVRTVEDGVAVEAEHVYVIPPNAVLGIEDGHLRLTSPRGEWGHRATIDHFFRSLAEDRGRTAVCIILSGTGSDGTLGLRAIKEHGGLTIAQAEGSAKYFGMPASAAATGQVDHVVPVEQMPRVLQKYAENLRKLDANAAEVTSLAAPEDDRLKRILSHLRAKVGHDFNDYKRSTVARRVQRRMQVLGLLSPDEYLERVKEDDGEAKLLFQDLLIGVTRFFRDEEAFAKLAEIVLPELFKNEETRGRDLRIWVPGCATGEEAYSLGILLCEYMAAHDVKRSVQIFATDIDEGSLEVARSGLYPEAIQTDLSEGRLATFFHRDGDGYRVVKRVREMCIFSRHDLIRDPPFSRLDLLSCRNLLIYFDSDLQKRVLPIFHYALRPSGFLFLGPSEGGTVAEDLFVPLAKTERVYRARDTVTRPPVDPLHNVFRPRFPGSYTAQKDRHRRPMDLGNIAGRVMFEEYGPPFVVINSRDEVIHFSGRTGGYLEPSPGAPSSALFSMARRGLAPDLRTVIRDARATEAEARRQRVRFRGQTGHEMVDLVARPLLEAGRDAEMTMIVFQEVRESEESLTYLDLQALADEDDVVRHLERELRTTREHLQSTIEELETSNEELKSSNEELLSMNEELQSTNEEMQTSKEELQSTNEELETVNSELSAKLDELARVNSDLKNLFESTQIATVFLDAEQRIKRFTPAAQDVFHLIHSDVGRPLSDIASRLRDDDLEGDIVRVMDEGEVVERQVAAAEGDAWFMLGIRPYVDLDGDQQGAVLTLVDVTELHSAQEEIARLNAALNRRVKELETILDLAPVGIGIGQDPECKNIRLNRAGSKILRLDPGSEASKSSGEDVPYRVLSAGGEIAPDDLPLQRAAATGETTEEEELAIELADGEEIQILMRATPLFDAEGRVRSAVGAFVDITDRQRTRELVELRARQQAAVAELGVAALSTADLETIFQAAMEVVADILEVPLVKLLAHDPETDVFTLRSGIGWSEAEVGKATVAGGNRTQAGYTLHQGEPVIAPDLHNEDRFGMAQILADHGVISGLSVPVRADGGIWGVMGAHIREHRDFSRDDIHFMQAVANVLGAALERQRMSKELADTQEQVALQNAKVRLRRAERLASVGTLAAGVAHEITNPVNSILMTAETALLVQGDGADGNGGAGEAEDEGPGGNVRSALNRIVAEAERCGMVVRDVLDFSRAQHTRKGRHQLNEVVASGLERARRFLEKPPKVTTDLANGLPEVLVAPLEVEQILINLLRNASESVEGTDQTVTVHVATGTGPRGWARLQVADDGPGMSEETLGKVFDPFFTTRRRSGGTGLGLSLVHSIVEDHDGNIDVRSQPGVGTRFLIDLPPAAELEDDEDETLAEGDAAP